MHGKVPYKPIPLVLISTKLLEMYSIYKHKYTMLEHNLANNETKYQH